MASDLRSSGFVRETRADNGKLVYRVWTRDRMFQFTAPKHQDTQTLVTSRLNACEDLAKQMADAGVTMADLIPPTDPKGVTLK